ncbi:MAG TPA: response regulator, partial [Cytophaga sp.]|nr:response regulator [Cytophaga sp.]
MKVLIVEDEFPAAQRLSKMILELRPDVEILAVLDSIESSIEWLKKHDAPNLLFLDIHLADGSSFEIFNHITIQVPVIFTTAYHEYALKAFEVNSIDYLLKPVKKEQLEKAFAKYKNFSGGSVQQQSIGDLMQLLQPVPVYKARFMVQYADKISTIDERQIAYFYS